MGLSSDFDVAVAAAARQPGMDSVHLVGSHLAWAAATVLGAQGAGTSLSGENVLRLPWGASDDDAEVAERLQFTAGEGPCLAAYADQEPVMASQAVIERAWPGFADLLFTRTPFRSVYSAPLGPLGSIDLYFTHPTGSSRTAVADSDLIVGRITAALLDNPMLDGSVESSLWRLPSVGRRSKVSIAIGLVLAALGVNPTNALALLRAYAFGSGGTVDDVAAAIVTGALDPDQLRGQPTKG